MKTKTLQTEIRVKLTPRSSRNQILGMDQGVLKVKVSSPPVDGKANKALIELLSEKLAVPKTSLRIVSGKTARTKTLVVQGLSPAVAQKRLEVPTP